MKNRLYNVIKLCVMAVLLGVTGQVYAQSTPRLIVNDLTNGSATWYSDKGKTAEIDAVPYSATEQTLYIDIQPQVPVWALSRWHSKHSRRPTVRPMPPTVPACIR